MTSKTTTKFSPEVRERAVRMVLATSGINHRRLLQSIGNISPAEAEDQYYAAADYIDIAA